MARVNPGYSVDMESNHQWTIRLVRNTSAAQRKFLDLDTLSGVYETKEDAETDASRLLAWALGADE